MTDPRVAAASAYRGETTPSVGERHDSLQNTSRKPLSTIEDALQAVIDECRRDKFWADMAKPAELAVAHLRKSASDPDDATKPRETAMTLLHHLDEQLQSASSASLFIHEAKMVHLVTNALDANASLGLTSPLSAVAAAAHREQAQAAQNSKQHEANMSSESQARLARVREAMVPYTFCQTFDNPEMTITVVVPPETKRSDVSVTVTRSTLVVHVTGHALQPVIDGKFLHPVDHTTAEWHLEGSHAARKLVIDCEKKDPREDWGAGLLAIGRSAASA